MNSKKNLFKQGIKKYQNGLYKEAIELLKHADTKDAHFCLGQIWSEQKEFTKSIENFEKCIELERTKYGDYFDGEIIRVLKELVPSYWHAYLNSSQDLKKELKESFKTKLEEWKKLNDRDLDLWKFSAISLEEEKNMKDALESWERAYRYASLCTTTCSFGKKDNHTTHFFPSIGLNINQLIEKVAAFRIMELSENKEEALDYLFNPFMAARYNFKFKCQGISPEKVSYESLEKILSKEKQQFLKKVYNKKVSAEVEHIETSFFKTGDLNTLIEELTPLSDRSDNLDFPLALAMSYYLKNEHEQSIKIIKDAMSKLIRNKKLRNVNTKSKNEAKEYTHNFTSFRIFPEMRFILKNTTKNELGLIQHYQKQNSKNNLGLNLPKIITTLNLKDAKWCIMLRETSQDPLAYFNQCSDKEKEGIIKNIIKSLAVIHVFAPAYDSGLISVLHTTDFQKNKQFYQNQIEQKFFESLEEVVRPYNMDIDKQTTSHIFDKSKIKEEREIQLLSFILANCDEILKKTETKEFLLQVKNNPVLYLPNNSTITAIPFDLFAKDDLESIKEFVKTTYKKEREGIAKRLEEKTQEYINEGEQNLEKFQKKLRSNKIDVDNLKQKIIRNYSQILDIIGSCQQGVYKDAFIKNFLNFEQQCVGVIDFETFSNLPYQMDLATLFGYGNFVSHSEEDWGSIDNLLRFYISEFNENVDRCLVKNGKIEDFDKFKKEYYACAIHRNLTLFGSFVKVGEKKGYLPNFLSNSINNIYCLMQHTSKDEDVKKLKNLVNILADVREKLVRKNEYSTKVGSNGKYG